MAGAALPVPNPEEALKLKLAKSIESFNRQRVPLLKRAFLQGGDEAVSQLEREYDALRDAYIDVLKRQLDANNHRYEELTNTATARAVELQESIDALDQVSNIIDGMGRVVSAVGSMLVILGI